LKFDLEDTHNYDIVANNERFAIDELARLIIETMKHKGILV